MLSRVPFFVHSFAPIFAVLVMLCLNTFLCAPYKRSRILVIGLFSHPQPIKQLNEKIIAAPPRQNIAQKKRKGVKPFLFFRGVYRPISELYAARVPMLLTSAVCRKCKRQSAEDCRVSARFGNCRRLCNRYIQLRVVGGESSKVGVCYSAIDSQDFAQSR